MSEELTVREQTLRKAAKAVLSERNKEYGEPSESLDTISKLWTTFLGHEVAPHQVAGCLALLKVARLKYGKSQDSWVDLAGYASIGSEVDDR